MSRKQKDAQFLPYVSNSVASTCWSIYKPSLQNKVAIICHLRHLITIIFLAHLTRDVLIKQTVPSPRITVPQCGSMTSVRNCQGSRSSSYKWKTCVASPFKRNFLGPKSPEVVLTSKGKNWDFQLYSEFKLYMNYATKGETETETKP